MRFPSVSIRSLVTLVAATILFMFMTLFWTPRGPQARAGSGPAARPGGLPLYFVENTGQVEREVAYYLKGRGRSVYFTKRGLTFALDAGPQAGASARPWALRLDF